MLKIEKYIDNDYKFMQKINYWLNQFIDGWKTHNISKVLALFTDNVEYYETPFYRLSNFDELRTEWQKIVEQNHINIFCDIFSKDDNKYTVKWDLQYKNNDNKIKIFSGIYLIKLNSDNKCNYFFHCGEELKGE